METDNIEIFSEAISDKKVRSRELKWLEMIKQGLAEWKSFPQLNRKLKDRCRKGKLNTLVKIEKLHYFQ
jgi:hypothetical protein